MKSVRWYIRATLTKHWPRVFTVFQALPNTLLERTHLFIDPIPKLLAGYGVACFRIIFKRLAVAGIPRRRLSSYHLQTAPCLSSWMKRTMLHESHSRYVARHYFHCWCTYHWTIPHQTTCNFSDNICCVIYLHRFLWNQSMSRSFRNDDTINSCKCKWVTRTCDGNILSE